MSQPEKNSKQGANKRRPRLPPPDGPGRNNNVKMKGGASKRLRSEQQPRERLKQRGNKKTH